MYQIARFRMAVLVIREDKIKVGTHTVYRLALQVSRLNGINLAVDGGL